MEHVLGPVRVEKYSVAKVEEVAVSFIELVLPVQRSVMHDAVIPDDQRFGHGPVRLSGDGEKQLLQESNMALFPKL